ncbi:hypothetical protein SDC9_87460 [bioreactor metagenome]|uniref:Uncharacterized protein n=1 Tax=bioreactor metagenome TaxID=1076179 RepID=A0A644ZIW0_9ZZZZ
MLVGIDEQQIVGLPARQLQRLVAVVGKILPRTLMQLARQITHEVADHLLRAVAGAGIDDHPAIDPRLHARQAAFDHMRLVLDDHVQADGGLGSRGHGECIKMYTWNQCNSMSCSHRTPMRSISLSPP